MLAPKIKLQAKWKQHRQDAKEQLLKMPAGNKNIQRELGPKRSESDEIAHQVSRHPEIPGEMELGKNDRQKLSEIILEYP